MRFKKKSINRVVGSSDLYYIGSSRNNLIMRIRSHWRGVNYRYAIPVVKNLYKTGKIEVTWIQVGSQIAEEVETKCLVKFFNEHLELPAGNASVPKWKKYYSEKNREKVTSGN